MHGICNGLEPECMAWIFNGHEPVAGFSTLAALHMPAELLQDQGGCAANVGFVVTAAAEAAVNVYMQQSWSKLNSSEQDFSFCK